MQQNEMERRIEAEHEARELALRDVLTGLANRRQFDNELKAAVSSPPRSGAAHAVFMLDLNDFKRINDVYGHDAGDFVLISAALRLQRAVRDGDLVARLGGDEFGILARHLPGAEEASNIALRVIKEFEAPVMVGTVLHQVSLGIGVALFPRDGDNERELCRKADIALYRAKSSPNSALCFFQAGMDAQVRERDSLARALRAAIRSGAVQAYYQPLIALKSSQVLGFEALARWVDPTLGEVPPDRFIPIAESCGLLAELTDLLLRQAACDACRWPAEMVLAFNISPSQLKDLSLSSRILSLVADAGLSPQRLEIEITESAIVQDPQGAQQVIAALRSAGVRVSLDDFGAGYSNLYHLRNFKVDKIKIDRIFIENMEREPEAAALVRALLGLGQGLGLTVTAEGVERTTQATQLLQEGCDEAQGFLYGRAMSSTDTLSFIAGREQQAVNV